MSEFDVDALRAAAETAHDEIVRLCSAHEDWRMSIPANPERDSDLIFDAVVNQIPYLLDRLAVAEAAVERVSALIPQTLDDHGEDDEDDEGCVCGWRWPEDDEGPNYDAHLAGALLAAIATEETR